MSGRMIDAVRRGDLLATGIWGGEHVSLESTEGVARLEFDCAHATIPRRIEINADGNFDVRGEYVREHGGPQRDGERPDSHPARFSGKVRGSTMTLTVTLTDTGVEKGTFTLGHGREPQINKCL